LVLYTSRSGPDCPVIHNGRRGAENARGMPSSA